MSKTELTCPRCAASFELQRHRGLRIAAATAGAVIGGALTDSVLIGAACAGISYWATGRAIRRYLQVCPNCHTRIGAAEPTPAPAPEPMAA